MSREIIQSMDQMKRGVQGVRDVSSSSDVIVSNATNLSHGFNRNSGDKKIPEADNSYSWIDLLDFHLSHLKTDQSSDRLFLKKFKMIKNSLSEIILETLKTLVLNSNDTHFLPFLSFKSDRPLLNQAIVLLMAAKQVKNQTLKDIHDFNRYGVGVVNALSTLQSDSRTWSALRNSIEIFSRNIDTGVKDSESKTVNFVFSKSVIRDARSDHQSMKSQQRYLSVR